MIQMAGVTAIVGVLTAIWKFLTRSVGGAALILALGAFLAAMVAFGGMLKAYAGQMMASQYGCLAGSLGAWEGLRVVLSAMAASVSFRVTLAVRQLVRAE